MSLSYEYKTQTLSKGTRHGKNEVASPSNVQPSKHSDVQINHKNTNITITLLMLLTTMERTFFGVLYLIMTLTLLYVSYRRRSLFERFSFNMNFCKSSGDTVYVVVATYKHTHTMHVAYSLHQAPLNERS